MVSVNTDNTDSVGVNFILIFIKMRAQFSLLTPIPTLSKGRRVHPWVDHFIDQKQCRQRQIKFNIIFLFRLTRVLSGAQQVPPPKKAQQLPPAATPPRILKLHVKCATPPTAATAPTAACPPTQQVPPLFLFFNITGFHPKFGWAVFLWWVC